MEDTYQLYDITGLKPGDHLCCLYENDEEHRAVLTPFLRMGLENNEKVIYIVDARTAETVLDYLREDGVKVEPYLKSGQLKILTVNDSYMKEGIFNPDKMIQLLESETKKAIDQGYSALRVTGEMSWALQGLPGSEKLIEYEAKLNQFFPENKCLAICQYDRRVFEANILLDILITHPIAVIGDEIYDNFYYIHPSEFLTGKLSQRILEHWINNLKNRKKLEKDLLSRKAQLEESYAKLKESERRYQNLFDNMLEGYAYCKMLFNEKGEPDDSIYLDVNKAFGKLTGLKDVVGKRVTEVIPRIKELEPELFAIYGRVSLTGNPETFEIFFKPLKIWLNISVFMPEREHFVAVFENITQRKETELALRESENRYRFISENTGDVIWLLDLDTQRFAYVSPNVYKLTGYTMEEVMKQKIDEVMTPESYEYIIKNLPQRTEALLNGDESLRVMSTRIDQIHKDGSIIPTEVVTTALFNPEKNKITQILGVSRDISERVRIEEELKKSLQEKEMLLKEIHHRVKNNLMIISSLLNLQSQYLSDKKSLDIFKESQNRARSMALIHERLYQSSDLKCVNFGEYIRTLSRELFHTYITEPSRVQLKINADSILLDINTAIPLGLIVNELVTNSLKHAFPHDLRGTVSIDFHLDNDTYELCVKDDGIGFPEDIDFQKTESLGLQMVNSLTKQIDGEICLEKRGGTIFSIRFKELDM